MPVSSSPSVASARSSSHLEQTLHPPESLLVSLLPADLIDEIISELILDAFRADVPALGATCRALRGAVSTRLEAAKRRRALALALCERMEPGSFERLSGGARVIDWRGVHRQSERYAALGCAGCAELGPLLKSRVISSTLSVLWLDNNQIGSAGCRSLAEAFNSGAVPLLRNLGLHNNRCGDCGLCARAHPLRRRRLPNLEVLGLANNGIGEHGLCALIGALGALPLLCGLYLHYNRISDGGLCQLAGALVAGRAPKLRWLQVHNNPSEQALVGVNALRHAMNGRNSQHCKETGESKLRYYVL